MTIIRTLADPTRPAGSTVTHRPISTPRRTGGTGRRSTAPRSRCSSGARSGEDGKLKVGLDGRIPSRPQARPDRGARVLARAWLMLAHALHAGAQRDLRHAEVATTPVGRREAVPARTADQRRAAGEDPHDRVDAGGHQPPDDRHRAAGQLVRPRKARRLQKAFGRLVDSEVDQRHPRLGDRPLRHPVLADRGVHLGLPDAPADPRRLDVPLGRQDDRLLAAKHASASSPASRRRDRRTRSRSTDLFYSFGHRAPRARDAAQLPAGPAGVPAARRPDTWTSARPTSCASRELGVPRYNEFRRHLHLPAPKSFEELTDNPRVGGGDPRGLRRRHRARGPDRRHVRRAASPRASHSATRRSGSSS